MRKDFRAGQEARKPFFFARRMPKKEGNGDAGLEGVKNVEVRK